MGASFYGRLEEMRSFCRKKTMSIKFLVLGGGGIFGFWEGGGVPILFLWARGFSEKCRTIRTPGEKSIPPPPPPQYIAKRGQFIIFSVLCLIALGTLLSSPIVCARTTTLFVLFSRGNLRYPPIAHRDFEIVLRRGLACAVGCKMITYLIQTHWSRYLYLRL